MLEGQEGSRPPETQQPTPTEASKTWKDRVKAGVQGTLDGVAGLVMIGQGLSTGDIPIALVDLAAGGYLVNEGYQGNKEAFSRTPKETSTGKPTFGEKAKAVGHFLTRAYTSEAFGTLMVNYATHGNWKPAVASALITGYMGVRGLMQGSTAIK